MLLYNACENILIKMMFLQKKKTAKHTADTKEAFIVIALTAMSLIILFILTVELYVDFYVPFKETRDYIKSEIKRAVNEDERSYWKDELHRFYICKMPIIRLFMNK